MSHQTIAIPSSQPIGPPQWKKWLSLDNRFVPPLFITLILLGGQIGFGILESYEKTLLAIGAAILTEVAMCRIYFS
jgi:Na+-translocating ferredoxin:NAD+ oxidoreductase RnfD subunit